MEVAAIGLGRAIVLAEYPFEDVDAQAARRVARMVAHVPPLAVVVVVVVIVIVVVIVAVIVIVGVVMEAAHGVSSL